MREPTYAELVAFADPDLFYQLEERAAIHEHCGKLSKSEAESRTARDYNAEQNKTTIPTL